MPPDGEKTHEHVRARLGRRELLAGFGAAAATTLTGCAVGDSTAVRPGTVTFTMDNGSWDPGYAAAGRELKKLTGFGLRTISNPDNVAYTQVTQLSLQTGKAADLIKWGSDYKLRQLARSGWLTDLSSVWTHYERKSWVPRALRSSMSYHDRVYGIPMYQTYYALFYIPKVFRQHGLRVPRTWQELLHCARVLKKAGVVPFVATQKGSWPAYEWFQELVSKIDPRFYSQLTSGRASYTDPRAKRAMRLWQDFMDRGWMTPADFDQGDGRSALLNGEVGMFLQGTWEAQGFVQEGFTPGTDFDAFVMPTVDPGTDPSVLTELGVLAVPKKASSHRAGMDTAAHWLHPRVQRAWTGFLQDGSANPQVEPSNVIVGRIAGQVKRHGWRQLIRYGETGPPNLIEGNTSDLGGFMTGATSADDTLRSMADRAEQEWMIWRRDES